MNPKVVTLQKEVDELDAKIEENREARAILSRDFDKLENDQAAIAEKLAKIRKDLGLNRKRGASLGELRDDRAKALKELQAAQDRALGQTIVTFDIAGPEAQKFEGTAADASKKFGMTVPEIIQHAGGTIQWDDLSVSFGA